jgi:2'-5' RNA ligase
VSKTRTFIAVPITPEVSQAASALVKQLQSVTRDVKWVAATNLHWTLQFLGDVEDTRLPAVCERVVTAAGCIESFPLEVRRVGAFPDWNRPRTVWLGAGPGGQEMVKLQESIQSGLEGLGFRPERRRYVPHLTLGRVGRFGDARLLAKTLEAFAEYDAGSMFVDEVVVYASQPTREGSSYHVLGRAELQWC